VSAVAWLIPAVLTLAAVAVTTLGCWLAGRPEVTG